MANQRYYSQRTIKILALQSSGFCAKPDCPNRLLIDATHSDGAHVRMNISHIHDLNPGGKRYCANLTKEQLNAPENLVLLCPNCHSTVDGQDSTFTAEMLKDWKSKDNERKDRLLEREIPNVQFHQLRMVAKAICSHESIEPSSMDLTPIVEKMDINHLSTESRNRIRIGYALQFQVEKFLQELDQVITGFESEVRSGFIKLYQSLQTGNPENGDRVFQDMSSKISNANGESSITMQTAQLGVMVYYFEKCDIFER